MTFFIVIWVKNVFEHGGGEDEQTAGELHKQLYVVVRVPFHLRNSFDERTADVELDIGRDLLQADCVKLENGVVIWVRDWSATNVQLRARREYELDLGVALEICEKHE